MSQHSSTTADFEGLSQSSLLDHQPATIEMNFGVVTHRIPLLREVDESFPMWKALVTTTLMLAGGYELARALESPPALPRQPRTFFDLPSGEETMVDVNHPLYPAMLYEYKEFELRRQKAIGIIRSAICPSVIERYQDYDETDKLWKGLEKEYILWESRPSPSQWYWE
ncbi:hypothetical protein EX30DRAFT_399111 [Ascodesmis nigricans]|uniref:Uncharacterized protein n=1 Tax=Ascodesmis nigricans TaxID=341454 RepID=A0A4V3SHL5_9PEZI|nr:hypothetical protein EX30DRAFT_399111 [Ascodesmis nigricans]